jgi:hypothetical protein
MFYYCTKFNNSGGLLSTLKQMTTTFGSASTWDWTTLPPSALSDRRADGTYWYTNWRTGSGLKIQNAPTQLQSSPYW